MTPEERTLRAKSTRQRDLILKSGSKIAVIGAGPAGVFFADFAGELARRNRLDVSIVLFDGKDFALRGPRGCNLCAGVISETLVERLSERGVRLPHENVQRQIEGYELEVEAGSLLLKHPLHNKRITTVFRGNGPRFSHDSANVSFDDYLLHHLAPGDRQVVAQPVKRIELPRERGGFVSVVYGTGDEESVFEADLVVGAFGLNTGLMERMQRLGFGYRPPRTVRVRCMEIPLEDRAIREHFGDNILICNWRSGGRKHLASVIPKKGYVTVSLVGRQDVALGDMLQFVAHLARSGRLPADWKLPERGCHCCPRIAVTSARRPFADRIVIVGDACCSRYFKNGIESAFLTAQAAAEAVFRAGVSAAALERNYFRRVRAAITTDNRYGRLLLRFNNLIHGSRFFSGVLLQVAKTEAGAAGKMTNFLWGMYTGNASYRRILRNFLDPALQWKLTIATFRLLFACIRPAGRSAPRRVKRATP